MRQDRAHVSLFYSKLWCFQMCCKLLFILLVSFQSCIIYQLFCFWMIASNNIREITIASMILYARDACYLAASSRGVHLLSLFADIKVKRGVVFAIAGIGKELCCDYCFSHWGNLLSEVHVAFSVSILSCCEDIVCVVYEYHWF